MSGLILIVDDDENNLSTLRNLLEQEQYRIEIARDGQAALEKIIGLLPDLVLLTGKIPRLDGIELCRKVRSLPKVMEIPILLVAALDDQALMERGYKAGVDDFLRKPYDALELRLRVRSLIRLRGSRSLAAERDYLRDQLTAMASAAETALADWMQAWDQRDLDAPGHSQRVAEHTVNMARRCGIEETELEHVRRGAILHDIGMIGIPARILQKAGPLDEAEWEIIKTHPTRALKMAQDVNYLHRTIAIPYCHHEKWDGSGYPRGLAGAQIPLSARIFAIVDVWDSLTSLRPYRTASGMQAAMDYILDEAGKHFDPNLVTIFRDYICESEPIPDLACPGLG